MKPTIFNSELWNTSYWYKSCGFYAAQNRNVIFPKTSKMPKPFHWGYFSYTIPSTFTFRYFDTVFVFIFSILSIYSNQYIYLLFLISPLFAIYYLGEVKTEKYFFAVIWLAFVIQNDYISLFLTLLSMLHITTFVANLFYFFGTDLTIYLQLWSLPLLFLIFYILLKDLSIQNILNIYSALGNKASPKKNNRSYRDFSETLHKFSKAQVLTMMVFLIFFYVTTSYIFIYLFIIVAANNTILRFMDASTERRILLTCVLFFIHLNPVDNTLGMLLLFLPFNFFSHVPEKNLSEYDIKNRLSDIEKLKKSLSKCVANNAALVEYTGPYEMVNRPRYLWYLYEYLLLDKMEVYPSIFSETIDLDFFNVYKEVFTKRELAEKHENFIRIFSVAILYTESAVEQFKARGYRTLETVKLSSFTEFGVEHAIIMELDTWNEN